MNRCRAWLLVWSCLLAGCPSAPRTVGFPPLAPPDELAREVLARDRERLADYRPEGPAAELQDRFHRLNRLSVEQRNQPAAGAELSTDMRITAKRVLESHGQEAIIKLGLFELAEFERRLDALREAAGRVDGSATPLLTGAPVPPGLEGPYLAFAEVGGDFLVLAGANELLRPGAGGRGFELDDRARFFARLAFKVYWSHVAPEATDALSWMLSAPERWWYERWVAESSRSAALPRRLKAIRYLSSKDASYPAAKARGVVLFQNREYPSAVQAFEEALRASPQDADLPSFLEEARRRAR